MPSRGRPPTPRLERTTYLRSIPFRSPVITSSDYHKAHQPVRLSPSVYAEDTFADEPNFSGLDPSARRSQDRQTANACGTQQRVHIARWRTSIQRMTSTMRRVETLSGSSGTSARISLSQFQIRLSSAMSTVWNWRARSRQYPAQSPAGRSCPTPSWSSSPGHGPRPSECRSPSPPLATKFATRCTAGRQPYLVLHSADRWRDALGATPAAATMIRLAASSSKSRV
ncbi:Uncharacterised protein [Mycobacteroides abscessus subsp. massiliense]|nr:Uncharacterised protein [Mycobacteroides abscessus subsp. massiliense]SKU02777.1 Uncharacterised protein [Mycobacteroides abscessus subsp. massiliense]